MAGPFIGLMVTNYDTHPPEKWAEQLLNELVPTLADMSAIRLIKVADAKDRLRPHVIAMVAAVRDAERQGFLKFNADEDAVFAATYRHYHGLDDPNGLHYHTLHKETKKVRASNDWADQYVQSICKVASEIDGHVGSNEMPDVVYRILDNWLNALQMCERSHHVSSNNLHLS